jgi:quinoprotein glucose dehydrogenase
MRYSSLKQIHTANVERLKLAWTFRTEKPGSEAIPIVIDGVMYVTAPDGVYALVPETGELLWKHDATPVALRGLVYWPGAGGLHSRVFAGNGQFLLALDVTTGKPAPGFGNEGRVDLKSGVLGDLKDGRYRLQSPPAVLAMSSSLGAAMARAGPVKAPMATFAAGMRRPVSCYGPFTPSPGRGKRVRRPGLPVAGRIDREPMYGGSSRSM